MSNSKFVQDVNREVDKYLVNNDDFAALQTIVSAMDKEPTNESLKKKFDFIIDSIPDYDSKKDILSKIATHSQNKFIKDRFLDLAYLNDDFTTFLDNIEVNDVDDNLDLETKIKVANSLLYTGNVSEAVSMWDHVRFETPYDLEVLLDSALSYRLLGDLEENSMYYDMSIKLYKDVLQLDPTNNSAYINLIDTMLRVEEYESSEILIRRGFQLFKDDPYIYLISGTYNMDIGNFEKSFEHLNSVLTFAENDEKFSKIFLGNTYLKMAQSRYYSMRENMSREIYVEVFAYLDKAYDNMGPNNSAEIPVFTGQMALDLKDYEGAETQFLEALKIDLQNKTAIAGLCDIYETQKRFDELINILEFSKDVIDTNDLRLVELYSERGDYKKALESINNYGKKDSSLDVLLIKERLLRVMRRFKGADQLYRHMSLREARGDFGEISETLDENLYGGPEYIRPKGFWDDTPYSNGPTLDEFVESVSNVSSLKLKR